MADPFLLARQGDAVSSFVRSILASQSAAAESAAESAISAASDYLSASRPTATNTNPYDNAAAAAAAAATATDDAITAPLDLGTSTTADLAATATAATNKATLEGVYPAYIPASATSTAGQASETSTFVPLADEIHGGPSGMTRGALAAAIIVPIIFASLALFLAYLFLRRRHNRKLSGQHNRLPSASAFFEKGNTRTSLQPLSPIVANTERNSAYFTGLDTSTSAAGSRGVSGEYYPAATGTHRRGGSDASTIGSDPPPPYKAMNASGRTSSTTVDPLAVAFDPSRNNRYNYVLPEIPSITREDSNSPFTDAAEISPLPNSPSNNTLRPTTSRTVSARSFSSTLYSDNASVHSAMAQRMSVVPIVVDRTSEDGSTAPVSPELSVGDPFEDVVVFGRRGSDSGVSTLRSFER
ncbi:hypothetical protein EJ03DRAFT_331727 [Teratosphaeria nubilosa]|uniref:Uncharacterized protein n=1 Tax=Teratosphaeria nubilosa TaxID=161662 RepID=A0A6G1KWZ4_9PEZI|nr:hypothetical protein EJ03DRAFT_331727 [Teratosphaeria nubilosa]